MFPEEHKAIKVVYAPKFDGEMVEGMVSDVSELSGVVIGSGAQDIVADSNEILTFKCSSCGAEVVIDSNELVLSYYNDDPMTVGTDYTVQLTNAINVYEDSTLATIVKSFVTVPV